jgi:hypothetical protein
VGVVKKGALWTRWRGAGFAYRWREVGTAAGEVVWGRKRRRSRRWRRLGGIGALCVPPWPLFFV